MHRLGKLALLSIFIMLPFIYVHSKYHYEFSTTLARTILSPLVDTAANEKFDFDAFERVKIGSPTVSLEKEIGQPLEKWCSNDECIYAYTYTYSGSHYDRRWLKIVENKVESKIKDFFID